MVAVPNIIMIIVALIAPVLFIVGGIIFVIVFTSPEDRFTAIIPKIIVVISIVVACSVLLLLPFDVVNITTQGRLDLPIEIAWQCFLGFAILFSMTAIPFGIHYYEWYSPEISENSKIMGVLNQIKWATIFTIIGVVVSLFVLAVPYWWLGIADIPVKAYYSPHISSNPYPYYPLDSNFVWNDDDITMRINPMVYVIGYFTLFGWMPLIIFGGCGLAGLPLEFFLQVKHRPKPLKGKDYADMKMIFKKKSEELMDAGAELQSQKEQGILKGAKYRRLFNVFKEAVNGLEKDWNKIEEVKKKGVWSPFLTIFNLIAGIYCIILGIIWIFHIFVYLVFPWPLIPSINWLLSIIDNAAGGVISPISTFLYGLLCFHLVIASIGGQVKMGERLTFFTIHPMKPHDTMTNSFLFNMGLLLSTSMAITMLCVRAFAGYCRGTAVFSLFNGLILNMRYIKYAWPFLPHALLLSAFVGIILSAAFHKKKDNGLVLSKEMQKMKNSLGGKEMK